MEHKGLVSRYFTAILEQENPEEVLSDPEHERLYFKLNLFLEEGDYTFSEEERKKIWCPAVDLWREKKGSTYAVCISAFEQEYFDVCDWVLENWLESTENLERALRAKLSTVEQAKYLIRKNMFSEVYAPKSIEECIIHVYTDLLKYLIQEYPHALCKASFYIIAGAFKSTDINDGIRYIVSKGYRITEFHWFLTVWMYTGNVEHLEFLLEQGLELRNISEDVLTRAVLAGGVDLLKFLKGKGYNLSRFLLEKVYERNLECVKWLLSSEGGVMIDENNPRTECLCRCAKNGDILLAQFLLKKGCDLERSTCTVPITAIEAGNTKMLNFLLKTWYSHLMQDARCNILYKRAIDLHSLDMIRILHIYRNPDLDSTLIYRSLHESISRCRIQDCADEMEMLLFFLRNGYKPVQEIISLFLSTENAEVISLFAP